MFEIGDTVYYVCDDKREHQLIVVDKIYSPSYETYMYRCSLGIGGEEFTLEESLIIGE